MAVRSYYSVYYFFLSLVAPASTVDARARPVIVVRIVCRTPLRRYRSRAWETARNVAVPSVIVRRPVRTIDFETRFGAGIFVRKNKKKTYGPRKRSERAYSSRTFYFRRFHNRTRPGRVFPLSARERRRNSPVRAQIVRKNLTNFSYRRMFSDNIIVAKR